jgi:hypothetical protein
MELGNSVRTSLKNSARRVVIIPVRNLVLPKSNLSVRTWIFEQTWNSIYIIIRNLVLNSIKNQLYTSIKNKANGIR